MARCELCGKEEDNLQKTKVSGATLSVCDQCSGHGTTLETENKNDSSTKYSTDGDTSENADKKSTSPDSSDYDSNSSGSHSQDNSFDDVDELALNYGGIIKEAREDKGLTREEFASNLGIKESFLRNIETEQTQPDVNLQKKIERHLDVDLSLGDIN